ncbi:hypothetical protein KAT84_03285 [Candidatus Bipolaricaulota bacterium]|nr:hypothetical protein [Candidatus Bipolaricaulota bacterium]
MLRKTKPDNGLSVAHVTIQATDYQDSGVGIVVALRPFTLLVPSHLIELVEQGQSHEILINGIPYEGAKILPTPALQRDYLSILQFRKKRLRNLTSAHLPRRSVQLSPGQAISLQRLASESNTAGKVVDVREQGDGTSIITDIEVATGDSGSPLLVSGQVAAVCQGMIRHEGIGTAVAVPLSHDGLLELRKQRQRYRISLISSLIAALLAVILAFGGFALYSSNSFTLATIEIPEDGSMVIARNAQTLTFQPSWSRSFNTPIRRSLMFSSHDGGTPDRIAIGTAYKDGIDGAISVLDANGSIAWSYSVPDGECIYSAPEFIYDGYLVDVIHIADLNEDGFNELLVLFVHNHDEPCKFVIFDLSGEMLTEYWHPGYIRTIATGKVGESDEVMVVVSASNNAIKTDWWNPQTLFAFRGLDIAGQGPPCDHIGAGGQTNLSAGTELWYQVIVNIDPDLVRAKCYEIDIRDFDGDGVNEIQAALTDGRFYYLDENGAQIHVKLGDRYHRDFPDVDPPPLVDLWEYHTSDETDK